MSVEPFLNGLIVPLGEESPSTFAPLTDSRDAIASLQRLHFMDCQLWIHSAPFVHHVVEFMDSLILSTIKRSVLGLHAIVLEPGLDEVVVDV